MNTAAENQTPAPKKKKTLNRVLIILIIVLSVFIIACLSLTVFLIARQGPTERRPMVLRHPSDAMVPAGATREDLEQAMEVSKDWAKSHIKGALNGAAQGDFSEAREDSLESAYPLWEMLESGRIARIANGTRCVMVDSGWRLCQVEISDGSHMGKRYWVYRRCLSRPRDSEVQARPFCGFMCASVYVRYFITAAICCAGIYALKLDSVLMQIVLFVIGMVLLNLLWARIAMMMIV
jgi:uncharacterized membrane protein